MAGSRGYRGKVLAQRVATGFVALLVLVLATISSTETAQAAGGSAYVVIEVETKRVMAASNANQKLPMASTTKIATAITVLERADLDEVVTVPKEALVEGSSIYLKAGEKWTVRDLLYGLMLRSGNDAAMALALHVGGSVGGFALMMNHTAYRAGAYHTHFVNPHGLHDEDHYTTAYDLAAITAYAMHNPTFAEIVATKSYAYTHPDGSKQVFVNKNKMLSAYPGADGVKTGYTTVAGRCLVSSATREGMHLVAVVLNIHDMWQTSCRLLDTAFATYRDVVLWQADEVKLVPYGGGKIPAKTRTTLRYPLSEEEVGRLKYEYHLDGFHRDPSAPLGEVLIRLDDAVVARSSLYAA